MKDIEFLKKNEIDVDKGIEILGDIEIYNEILNDFFNEIEDRVLKLEEYKQNKDMENYAILVHALKGDSNYLGFTKLAEMALSHQLKSQDGDILYIEEHYGELKEEIDKIVGILKEYLEV